MTSKAVVLVVDDDTEELGRIRNELASRYARDYEIVCADSVDQAMHSLQGFAAARRDIALVLADQWMPSMTGAEFLAAVKAVDATTKRALLLPWGGWGDRATAEAIVRAMTLGHIEYYVLKPWQVPDELFHRTITTFLHEWRRSRPSRTPQITVVGHARSRRSYEVRDFLTRGRFDHVFYPADSEEGKATLRRSGCSQSTLPVVALLDGRVSVDPSNAELANAMGLITHLDRDEDFDVVIVGAGPAGLAAAVYGSSEGLRTVVVEREAIGGQAGSSSLIRNYLGFARGVSGSELAQQAYQQAWLFGTTFLMTRPATGIRRDGRGLVVSLEHGEEVVGRKIILATGVSYRRLHITGVEELLGAGVFYGASAAEARGLEGGDVLIVGGGNSAGQAAIHLSAYASNVTLVVRGDSLADSMSDYLIKMIESASNVRVWFNSEVVDARGEGRLESVVLRNSRSGREETVAAAALFVLIGAQPYTEWLPDEIERDRWGFVLTGGEPVDGHERRDQETRMLLETSMPDVLAVGDVRHGSEKRVASAVAEGSIAIRLIHLQG
ncbi:MAG: FAD-dependent oxidoreductase [Actinomycetota bacterium]